MNLKLNKTDFNFNETDFINGTSFRSYKMLKRVLDFICASLALTVGFIPMLLLSLIIIAESKGPAVFRQKRIGLDGKEFTCLKFRSMKVDAPSCATAELDDPDLYITKIGKLMRKTSLDELPQLINIIKGDMSFIGPRPLIPEESYIHEKRLDMGVYNLRPGISGYAQINGRDLVSPDEKVFLDTVYLHNFSFITDVKIFFATILSVLKSDGVVDGKVEAGEEKDEEKIPLSIK